MRQLRTAGCTGRTQPSRSAAGPRWTGCYRATWPTCTWSGSTWTPSVVSEAFGAASRPVPPVVDVRWQPAFRIVPSRYPPIDLFERIAPPGEWEALIELESLTND